MNKLNNIGIGVDIENIERFRKLDFIENKSLLNKIFTKKELEYCYSKEMPASHLAVRYTAKEAIIKALNSMGNTINFKEIEINNNKNGVPIAKINNFDNFQIYLSLSHCEDKAIAFTIVISVSND